jgi:hypothetical protein
MHPTVATPSKNTNAAIESCFKIEGFLWFDMESPEPKRKFTENYCAYHKELIIAEQQKL